VTLAADSICQPCVCSDTYGAFERARLTSLLTRSLVEEFLAKYLKATAAPDLDLVVRVDKK
jgi:hypothetical protein